MRMKPARLASALLTGVLVSSSGTAGIVLKPAKVPVAVAKSTLTVTPDKAWNKVGRPGRFSESWTLDGLSLNDLTFYGGILDGKTLFREVDKTNAPLPRFSKTMLAPDVVQLFESSYRIALNTPLIKIESIEPATFAGHAGFRFTYSFSALDEVKRKGEAIGAIVGERLYMATFEAPTIHYFDRDVAAFRAIVDSAKLVIPKKK